MKKILIVQHCQSEHHISNMTGGWTDTPLTELGRQQAKKVGKRLIDYIGDEDYIIYTSDLKRASQTADIINDILNLDIVIDKGIREINTGEAAGKTKDWARQNRNPLPTEGFNIDYQEFKGGETWRQFYNRIHNTMERIFYNEEKNLILVTHGCALSYMLSWWMKFKIDMLDKAYFSASPGSITYLLQNKLNQNVMRVLNDTAHLNSL